MTGGEGGSGRLIGAADLPAVRVVLHILHEGLVHAAALFDDHAAALVVENPDLIIGKVRVGLSENPRLVQAAEAGAALLSIQPVAGAVLIERVLHGLFLKVFPVFAVNVHYIVGLYHVFSPLCFRLRAGAGPGVSALFLQRISVFLSGNTDGRIPQRGGYDKRLRGWRRGIIMGGEVRT